MEKPVAVIEVTNRVARLIIGNIVNDKPVIIYQTEKPISGMVLRGDIVDLSGLSSIISSMKMIADEQVKLKVNIVEATVLFPPVGFSIYLGDKTTNVVSPTSIIESIDIQNVISLVQKEPVPNGSEIVDIIPDAFILEQGRSFLNPPLGEKSNNIQLKAKVQTLPTRTVSDYRRAVEGAGIKVRRTLVCSYAITEALSQEGNSLPPSYILIDMGAGLTNLSLVGNHSIFISNAFQLGGNDLAMKISESFNIGENEAVELMENYGLNDRELVIEPEICQSMNEYGQSIGYTPNDLNEVIKDFMKNEYFVQLQAALDTLLSGYGEDIRSLPIIFTGGFSKLSGFKELAKNKFTKNQQLIYYCPSAIGARDPKFTAVVGAVVSSSKYKGTLSDTRAKVTSLKRVETK